MHKISNRCGAKKTEKTPRVLVKIVTGWWDTGMIELSLFCYKRRHFSFVFNFEFDLHKTHTEGVVWYL